MKGPEAATCPADRRGALSPVVRRAARLVRLLLSVGEICHRVLLSRGITEPAAQQSEAVAVAQARRRLGESIGVAESVHRQPR